MAWYWWVLITLAAFALGMASMHYFQKSRPPERRIGNRRQHDRRSDEDSGEAQRTDRRRSDRRVSDRRKGKPAWQLATVVVSAVFLSIVGVVAYAESQVASIFAGAAPDLINSGWADCDTPITWSIDTSRVSAADARMARNQFTQDFAKWGTVSGLEFRFVGEVPVIYDDTNFVVTSDVNPSERHVYIAFLPQKESSLLDQRTVGFASPTKVWKDSKQIVEGSVVLSIEYVKKASAQERSAVYLHEIGHVLGLGHGTSPENVMYYLVDDNNTLSPGDIEGIRSLIKACKAE
jgi:Matrixin